MTKHVNMSFAHPIFMSSTAHQTEVISQSARGFLSETLKSSKLLANGLRRFSPIPLRHKDCTGAGAGAFAAGTCTAGAAGAASVAGPEVLLQLPPDPE